jgi:hypothetical protein
MLALAASCNSLDQEVLRFMNELVQSTLAAQDGGISFFALFWQAHIVVKIVMIGLLGASVWCWAIILSTRS